MVVLRGGRRAAVSSQPVAVVVRDVERLAEIGRGAQDHGVGDEGQAEGLVYLVVEVAATDVALTGKEQLAA